MNNSEVAHKWVHGMLGTKGELNGSNMHADSLNMRSYSTVIAQCLDRKNDVFIVIDENLTPSTSKHINYVERALPDDYLVIRTHFSYSYGYDNVQLLRAGQVFDKQERFNLIYHLLTRILFQYENVLTGKTLDTEVIDKRYLCDINRLDSIYHDCSLKNWLRSAKKLPFSDEVLQKRIRKMVRMIIDEKTDAEIADVLFGAGTWDAMQRRIAPLKKARNTRVVKQMVEYKRRQEIADHYRNMPTDELFQAWRNFDTRIPHDVLVSAINLTGGNVILRFSKDGEHIETSKGIRMTIDEALRCWRIVMIWEERHTFTEGMKFAGYSVQSYQNGILKAGCHTVTFHEMNRMHKEIMERLSH